MHINWMYNLIGWWAIKVSIIISFLLMIHLPQSLQKLRRNALQGLSIFIILHWVLLPYYYTVWEYLTYISKCLLVLQTFLRDRDIHVWLTVWVLLLWGCLPWLFLFLKAPTNWSKNLLIRPHIAFPYDVS